MQDLELLNPLAMQVWTWLVTAYPQWQQHFGATDGELEVAIPAPPGSKAGHLIVLTTSGKDIWVRYSLPHLCYAIDGREELLSIIERLLGEKAVFVMVMKGDEWTETTLLRPGQKPHLEPEQVAHVVSWSGIHDRIISNKLN